MRRTMMCGEVRAAHVGQAVVLQGWVHTVRDHGGLIFLDLRDRAGLVQVLVNPANASEAHAVASELHDEYVVEVHGQVERRPAGSENPKIATGEGEVHASQVVVLNPSLPPPFPVAEDVPVDERLRLQDRYLHIARCFRDEDLRANRASEFTQLDLEMSFVEPEDVFAVCEELFTGLTESLSSKRVLQHPWPRLTWQTAMDVYGSDKPDLRYELPIVDVSAVAGQTEFQVFKGAVESGGG